MIKGEVPAMLSEKYELTEKTGYLSVFVLPFIMHLGFLAATAIFVMHVQVCDPYLFSICYIVDKLL